MFDYHKSFSLEVRVEDLGVVFDHQEYSSLEVRVEDLDVVL